MISVEKYIELRHLISKGADIGTNKDMDDFEQINDLLDTKSHKNCSRNLMPIETFLNNLIQHSQRLK